MKLTEALKLREGDLVEVRIPDYQAGGIKDCIDCKVLIVSSRGAVYAIRGRHFLLGWGPRWVPYRQVRLLGGCEALTEQERVLQVAEIGRFEGYRAERRRKEGERRLRGLRPQEGDRLGFAGLGGGGGLFGGVWGGGCGGWAVSGGGGGRGVGG